MLKSPFRYPGSKSKAAERIVKFLRHDTIVEPFVGGGSVMLLALDRGKSCVVNDKDPDVSAFWQVVFGAPKDLAALAGRLDFQPTVKAFRDLQKSKPSDLVEKAFKAIVLNRCSYSGIKTAGPIGGDKQGSDYTVDCRYNGPKLINQIMDISKCVGRVTVLPPLDFEEVLSLNHEGDLYIDPPYYKQGDSLYEEKMTHDDHVRLSKLLHKEDRVWLLSYDTSDIIKGFYEDCHQKETEWTYEGTHEKGKELLVSNRDLETWGKRGFFG